MQEYNITIFRQSRILLSLFLIPLIFLIAIVIGTETDSLIISFLFLLSSFFGIYYFVIGHLKISVKNDEELFFEWRKKIFFNYNPIPSIKFTDIKIIVIDEDKLLRKIKTNNNDTIYINNSKIKSEEADKFINKLKYCIKKNDIKIIDSWDEFAEKGYLRTAYIINSILIFVSIILIIVITILKGFKPVSLSFLLLFIPQMILYRKQMKDKID